MCNKSVQVYVAGELVAINKILDSIKGFEEAVVLVECAIERVNQVGCECEGSNIHYRDCQ